MMKLELKDVIRQKRKELNLTQEQFALLLNVATMTVSRWERGLQVPRKEELNRMGLFNSFNAAQEEESPIKNAPLKNSSPIPGTEVFATLGLLIGQLHNAYPDMAPADQKLVKEMLIRCLRLTHGDKWVDDFLGISSENVV